MSEGQFITKYVVGYDANGRICFAQESPFGELAVPTGLLALEVTEAQFAQLQAHVGSERFYVENGVVYPAADRPTVHHDWDWETKVWLPNLARALAVKKREIEREATRRTLLPITFDASPFDADATARERISGTLARLLRGGGLPVGWVGWRDANNDMHWASDTPEVVQGHLAGLSAAIENRVQAVLVAAWTHKAQLSTLTTIEDVLGYSLTTGWPS